VSEAEFGLRVTYSGRRGLKNIENRIDQILISAKYTPRADLRLSRLVLLVFNAVRREPDFSAVNIASIFMIEE
jgi:hypothetical protein